MSVSPSKFIQVHLSLLEYAVSDAQHIWSQQEGEPSLWYGRFLVYLRLGTKRSVNAVFKKENNKKQQKTTSFPGPGWYDAEKEWNWKERAKAYDEYVRAEEDRVIAEEREKVLRSGFALMHKRVKELDRLTRKLIRMASDDEKIWLVETRTVIMGEDRSQTTEKLTFNAPLFQLIDKYLDSIAKEMGERIKKQELTGKDGGPVEFEIELVGNSPDDDDSEA